ncbi:MAG: pyridoxal-phosphate dependent enzyme [Tepidanaerobacteraceae bacterium]|nr:pyridoxal-phosphate dependent enzyme [Tepidanaerobacteraceae bacterium]
MLNSFIGVECIRCGRPLADNLIFNGCPHCKDEGYNVNYKTKYNYSKLSKMIKEGEKPFSGKGVWRYRQLLPIKDHTVPITLDEGDTPLRHLKKLGKQLGLSNLYVKDESRNPTWSYKDRLCSVAVTKAVEDGAEAITISSTGNHGAATAAYAAVAGIPCVVFTIPQVPDTMKTLMQSYGAFVVATPTPIDRWTLMKQCVKEFNWVPISGYVSPPIGSNPYGIDGYKSISFEIFEELGEAPDFVSVPAAYSDGLYGVWSGMRDLRELGLTEKLPKMVAAEVFGSLRATLQEKSTKPVSVDAEWSVSFSIAGSLGTYQGLSALKESDGLAETSNDDETMKMQKALASTEGLYAEAASVTSLVAISKLRKAGKIQEDDKIVAVITSTGLKDPAETAKYLPKVPLVEPNLSNLSKVLKEYYSFGI